MPPISPRSRPGPAPAGRAVALLVSVAGAMIVAPASAALGRWGPRPTAVTGTLLVTLGVFALSQPSLSGTAGEAGAVFAMIGAGFAAVMVTATGTVVGDAPPEYAGAVGGLKQTASNIGPTLGIAVATSAGATTRAGTTLLLLAAVALLGLLPAVLLPGRRP